MQVSAISAPPLEEKISHQLAHPLVGEKMVNVVAPFEETEKVKQTNVCIV